MSNLRNFKINAVYSTEWLGYEQLVVYFEMFGYDWTIMWPDDFGKCTSDHRCWLAKPYDPSCQLNSFIKGSTILHFKSDEEMASFLILNPINTNKCKIRTRMNRIFLDAHPAQFFYIYSTAVDLLTKSNLYYKTDKPYKYYINDEQHDGKLR